MMGGGDDEDELGGYYNFDGSHIKPEDLGVGVRPVHPYQARLEQQKHMMSSIVDDSQSMPPYN